MKLLFLVSVAMAAVALFAAAEANSLLVSLLGFSFDVVGFAYNQRERPAP